MLALFVIWFLYKSRFILRCVLVRKVDPSIQLYFNHMLVWTTIRTYVGIMTVIHILNVKLARMIGQAVFTSSYEWMVVFSSRRTGLWEIMTLYLSGPCVCMEVVHIFVKWYIILTYNFTITNNQYNTLSQTLDTVGFLIKSNATYEFMLLNYCRSPYPPFRPFPQHNKTNTIVFPRAAFVIGVMLPFKRYQDFNYRLKVNKTIQI